LSFISNWSFYQKRRRHNFQTNAKPFLKLNSGGIYNKKSQILGNLLCRNMQVTKLHVKR